MPDLSRVRRSPWNRSIVTLVIFSISSFAVALPTPLECVSEAGELVGCVSLPSDAPLTSRAQQPKITDARPTNKISLLTGSEIAGGEAMRVGQVTAQAHGLINPAMSATLEAQYRLQRIEVFLKSGPIR